MTANLSTDQLESFERDGYLVFEGLLTKSERDSLREEVDDLTSKRSQGVHPMIVSYAQMAMLTSHPKMMDYLEHLMHGQFSLHHIHSARHDAHQPPVNWHQDYEQVPQTNRSHLMVHIFYYLDGLNGTIGDLLLCPGSHNSVIAGDALTIFGTEDLPGSIAVDNLSAGSAIIVHSALFHARRVKPGGENAPRYFIDISYCQNGVLWPGYPNMAAINEKAREVGANRGGKYSWLYDTDHFFDKREIYTKLKGKTGSLALELSKDIDTSVDD